MAAHLWIQFSFSGVFNFALDIHNVRAMGTAWSSELPGASSSTGKVGTGAAEGPGAGFPYTPEAQSQSSRRLSPPGHQAPPDRRAGSAPRPR